MARLTKGLQATVAHAQERKEAVTLAMTLASLEAQIAEARLRADGLL